MVKNITILYISKIIHLTKKIKFNLLKTFFLSFLFLMFYLKNKVSLEVCKIVFTFLIFALIFFYKNILFLVRVSYYITISSPLAYLRDSLSRNLKLVLRYNFPLEMLSAVI